jgi:hypothetical protein
MVMLMIALVVMTLLAVMPDRMMHDVLFGGQLSRYRQQRTAHSLRRILSETVCPQSPKRLSLSPGPAASEPSIPAWLG